MAPSVKGLPFNTSPPKGLICSPWQRAIFILPIGAEEDFRLRRDLMVDPRG